MLKRLKRITSYTGHARFLAECSEKRIGTIPRQTDILSPYHYSQEWDVLDWNGKPVIIRETSHRRFDVFAVPDTLITHDQRQQRRVRSRKS